MKILILGIFLVLKSASILATNGICPLDKITVITTDRRLVESCVTLCNQKAAEYIAAQQGKVTNPEAESWIGYAAEWIQSKVQSTIIAYDPNVQTKMGAFNYGGFATKFLLVPQDLRTNWCVNLVGPEFDAYESANKKPLIRELKGCVTYLNLYEGCHSLCRKEAKAACGIN